MTSLSEKVASLENSHLAHPQYRPDIDGLRAIAVLSVVGFHAFPTWLKGGFIGVDIFFVISGYLISTIIFKSIKNNSFSFSEFYGRRIKRIFPALILVLSACLIGGWFVLFSDEYSQLGKHTTGGAVFVSNIILWNESGYFDTSAEVKPLLHLWSLGIEEQFYIFWPLALWLSWRLRLNILLLAVALAIFSFSLNIANIKNDPSAVFYLAQTRIWELLAGSLLAYFAIFDSGKMSIFNLKGKTFINAASMAGISLISLGLICINKDDSFPGWWAALPVLGTVLVIAAGPNAWINKSILSSRMFVWFGLISFPLYLWHWPLLTFARIIESEMPSREIRIALVSISIILAWATYFFIERPLRANNSRFKTPALAALMAIVGTSGLMIFNLGGLPHRDAVKDSEAPNSQFVGPLWKFAKNDTCINRYPFKEAQSYGWWFCITNKDEQPTLLLLGNSFANHLYPGMATEEKLRTQTVLSIGACPPDMGSPSEEKSEVTTSPCSGPRAYHQKLLINNIIERSGTIKYAILDGLDVKPSAAYIQNINERIDYLEKRGVRVIVFIPHFTANRSLKGCFARPLKKASETCDISPEFRTKIYENFKPAIEAISKNHPNVKFFDQNELFCNDKGCSLVQDGMPLYRDEYNHYSEYASKKIARLFTNWAKYNAPDILDD